MKNFLLALLSLTFTNCASLTGSNYTLVNATALELSGKTIIGQTASGQDIFLGGLSGLNFISEDKDELYFYSNTDRGPNGYMIGNERPFLVPQFSPLIVRLRANLNNKTLEVVDSIKLKRKNGTPLSGVPNVRHEENPVDSFGFMISLDAEGLDTEGITRDPEGGFWIADEYGPSLVHFDADGKMLRRLRPFAELPKIYSERTPNRGFEGISLVGNRLYGFLQAPIKDEKFSRIVEVDLESMKSSNEYFYSIDKDKDRIGDAVSIGENKFLVVELNGKAGDKSSKCIYKVTLDGPDRPVKKELLIDLNKTTFKNKEKVEGIALIGKNKIGLVNDNDFQIAGPTDKATGMTPLNNEKSEMLILEFKEDLTI